MACSTYADLQQTVARLKGNSWGAINDAMMPLHQIATNVLGLSVPARNSSRVSVLLRKVPEYMQHLQQRLSSRADTLQPRTAADYLNGLQRLLKTPAYNLNGVLSEQRLQQVLDTLEQTKKQFRAMPAKDTAAPAPAAPAAAAAAAAAGWQQAPRQQRRPKRRRGAAAQQSRAGSNNANSDSDADSAGDADSGRAAPHTRRQAAVPAAAASVMSPSPLKPAPPTVGGPAVAAAGGGGHGGRWAGAPVAGFPAAAAATAWMPQLSPFPAAGAAAAAAAAARGAPAAASARGAPAAAQVAGVPGAAATAAAAAAAGGGSGAAGHPASFDVAALQELIVEKSSRKEAVRDWTSAIAALPVLVTGRRSGRGVLLTQLPGHLPTILDTWAAGRSGLGTASINTSTAVKYCRYMRGILSLPEVQQVLGQQQVKQMKQRVAATEATLKARLAAPAAGAEQQAPAGGAMPAAAEGPQAAAAAGGAGAGGSGPARAAAAPAAAPAAAGPAAGVASTLAEANVALVQLCHTPELLLRLAPAMDVLRGLPAGHQKLDTFWLDYAYVTRALQLGMTEQQRGTFLDRLLSHVFE